MDHVANPARGPPNAVTTGYACCFSSSPLAGLRCIQPSLQRPGSSLGREEGRALLPYWSCWLIGGLIGRVWCDIWDMEKARVFPIISINLCFCDLFHCLTLVILFSLVGPCLLQLVGLSICSDMISSSLRNVCLLEDHWSGPLVASIFLRSPV